MTERRPIKSEPTADVATAAAANGGEPATFAQVQAEIEARLAAGPELTLAEKFEWFERKLKAALSDNSVTANELSKIVRETDLAIEAARQEAVAARERGLDFCAVPDSKLARECIDNAEFAISRFDATPAARVIAAGAAAGRATRRLRRALRAIENRGCGAWC
jgi:hypothetical protein